MPGPSSWKPEQNFSSHNEISRPVQRHLVNVYLVLAGMLGLAAFGSTLNVGAASGGMLETGVVLGSVFGIRHLNPENRLRWLLLGTYALFSGMSLSTLITVYLYWDPSGSLLFSALAASMFIFLGFSLSAMLANRRSLLYAGGLAGSLVGILLWTSLANVLFIRSSSMFSAELYLGLIAFSGFVVYDTQMIVERASAGWLDVPGHAMELFMDLFALFVRIAMIFLRKDEERVRKRGRDERRGDRQGRPSFQRLL